MNEDLLQPCQDYNVKMHGNGVCVCVHVCMHMCESVCVRMCVIIIARENRGMKKSNCINYGSEVDEKGLIYLETSVCLCRDSDMVLIIFFLKISLPKIKIK